MESNDKKETTKTSKVIIGDYEFRMIDKIGKGSVYLGH